MNDMRIKVHLYMGGMGQMTFCSVQVGRKARESTPGLSDNVEIKLSPPDERFPSHTAYGEGNGAIGKSRKSLVCSRLESNR